ncbi:MAG: 4-hydroxyphenylacetate 3-hydroxylase family protein [Acuticoccus sp.]
MLASLSDHRGRPTADRPVSPDLPTERIMKSGANYLEGLRDGRVVYIGGERIDDVTTHAAFRNAARSYAAIYDARSDPARRADLLAEEDGETFAAYYMRPRSRADLQHRTRASAAIADLTHGMMGRSPDFVGGYMAGAAMQPEAFDAGRHPVNPQGRPWSDVVREFYLHCRRADVFLSHAVAPPQGTRDARMYGRTAQRVPSLSVVDQDAEGITISGMKMLATSAAFSDEIWIGNILPLAEGHEAEAVTCIVPPAAPGLSLWSRKPFERHAVSEFDNYLSAHFDEGDFVVVCDNVKVPWHRVFGLGDIATSRAIYFATPAHTLSNHQAAVRYRAKVRLLIGLARRITQSMGIDKVPAVADDLGHLAALCGMLDGMIAGQIEAHETLPNGYVNYNRAVMYSTIYFATQHYDEICAKVRELSGGSVLQMPADASVLDNPETRAVFEELWASPQQAALEKFKLFKLAWDLLGTDFGGRHLQYERFYMGPAFVVRGHVSRESDWDAFEGIADAVLAAVPEPGAASGEEDAA